MELEFFEKSIENKLYSVIGIRIKVSLKDPQTIAEVKARQKGFGTEGKKIECC